MIKKYLFALQKPSYSGLYVQEIIDIILTTAAFEQEVSILLLDDAVFHLNNNQNAINSAYKNTATLFPELLKTEIGQERLLRLLRTSHWRAFGAVVAVIELNIKTQWRNWNQPTDYTINPHFKHDA